MADDMHVDDAEDAEDDFRMVVAEDRLDNILGDAQFEDRGLDTDAVNEHVMGAFGYDRDGMRKVFDAKETVFRTLLEAHGETMVAIHLRAAIQDLVEKPPSP